jgi:hypothetical protein
VGPSRAESSPAGAAAGAGAVDGEDGDLTHSGIHFGTHSGAEASVAGVVSAVGAEASAVGAEASAVGAEASVAGAVGTLTSLVSGTRTDQFIMVEV